MDFPYVQDESVLFASTPRHTKDDELKSWMSEQFSFLTTMIVKNMEAIDRLRSLLQKKKNKMVSLDKLSILALTSDDTYIIGGRW